MQLILCLRKWIHCVWEYVSVETSLKDVLPKASGRNSNLLLMCKRRVKQYFASKIYGCVNFDEGVESIWVKLGVEGRR